MNKMVGRILIWINNLLLDVKHVECFKKYGSYTFVVIWVFCIFLSGIMVTEPIEV